MSLPKFKITFIGDQSTGKTSLITRFKHGSFDGQYQATIGVDFMSKTVFVGGTSVRLQLWDSAGQDRFTSLIPSYLRDSLAVVMVFDLSSRQSLSNLSTWLEYVRNSRGEDVQIFVVGNKSDLSNRLPTTEGAAFAEKIGATYFEVSAKSGDNVELLFKTMAEKLLDLSVPSGTRPVQTVKLDAVPPSSQSNCSC